jgi:hypothetical protein
VFLRSMVEGCVAPEKHVQPRQNWKKTNKFLMRGVDFQTCMEGEEFRAIELTVHKSPQVGGQASETGDLEASK